MSDHQPEIMKALPGTAGAFVSMMFLRGSWPTRMGMFLAGAVLAYYGTPWAVKFANLDPGFAGFLMGLFGMAIVSRLFEAWWAIAIASIVGDWIRKLLGLPPKEH